MAKHHVFHHRIVRDENVRRILAYLLSAAHVIDQLMPIRSLLPVNEIRFSVQVVVGCLARVHADRDSLRALLKQPYDALELVLDKRIHGIDEKNANTRLLKRFCVF